MSEKRFTTLILDSFFILASKFSERQDVRFSWTGAVSRARAFTSGKGIAFRLGRVRGRAIMLVMFAVNLIRHSSSLSFTLAFSNLAQHLERSKGHLCNDLRIAVSKFHP